jgi:endoglucanase
VWRLDEQSGPLPGEPSSKCWLYHSHVHGDAESNLGLVGSIVVTDPLRARPDGTPKDVEQEVRNSLQRADAKGDVPVLVAYDVPGRDCSQYSAGGAPTGDAYKAWIDGFAAGLGGSSAVVILEPDGLALPRRTAGSRTRMTASR